MLLIKNPRIFHNISVRSTFVYTLVAIPFLINDPSSFFEDFFIFARLKSSQIRSNYA